MKGGFAMANEMRNSMNINMQHQNKNCEELMKAISEASFFALDLKLYLDTHPDDCRALEMYREACKQYSACKGAFEECCYPLTSVSAGQCGEWDWLDGCWPPLRM